jgi:hypothetical protein
MIPTTCTSPRTARKRSWWPSRMRGWTSAMRIRWPAQQPSGAGVQGHQPRRFLDRRPLRDLHLRIRRQAGQDRHGQAQGGGLSAARQEGHAAGHPRLARRQGVLRRRHDGEWCLPVDGDSFSRSVSFRPGSARMGCIRAGMAPSCMSPIAAPTASTDHATARAACR